MNGYMITFFMQQNHRHHGQLLANWLLHLAKELNLRGATLIPASQGLGSDHRLHSAHFFDLADQPLSVLMAVTVDESNRLFDRLKAEGVKVFYVKSAVEFGTLGGQ